MFMNKSNIHIVSVLIALLCCILLLNVIAIFYLLPDLTRILDLLRTNPGRTIDTITPVIVFIVINVLISIIAFVLVRIGRIIRFLDQYILTTIIVSCILSGMALTLGAKTMFKLVDKYRYVDGIRQAVESVARYESPPDAIKLARSYLSFPGRREVPVLMVRIGHIFTSGGNWEEFVKFQKTYADILYNDFKKLPDWCSIVGTDHDPVSYVAITYGEASVSLRNNTLYPSDSSYDGFSRALKLLTECPETDSRRSVRREIPRMIYAARFMSLLANFGKNEEDSYDPEAEIYKIEQKIEKLDSKDKQWLFTSLAFQEFLDFRIKIAIQKQEPEKCDYTDDAIDEITSHIHRLLALRSKFSTDGNIRWTHSPGKMDTHLMIMAMEGHNDARKRSSLIPYVDTCEALSKKINGVLNVPDFSTFRSENSWYKSTPADFSITESSLKEIFETWLRTGWSSRDA